MNGFACLSLILAPITMAQAQVSYPPTAVTPADVQSVLQNQVQATTAITQSDGSFSGNWPIAFASQPTSYIAGITSTSNTPLICSMQAVDMNTYSGKCFQLSATTLPATVTAVLGLVVSPVSNAAAGQTVRVFGKQ